jgi:hypothetical protein
MRESRQVTLAGVPGVPETVLGAALLARLPASSAPAPWEVSCQAVVWFHRPGPGARDALAPALRGARPLLVAGALVRYVTTPVGAYDEVLGLVIAGPCGAGRLPWGTVAFMAVDSEASLVGGRANWGMPKTLAAFERSATGPPHTARGADAAQWRVTAVPDAHGPRLPVRARLLARQVLPSGSVGDSRLRGRGTVRAALVAVGVESDGPLAGWLRPGRHVGAVVADGTFRLAAPALSPTR